MLQCLSLCLVMSLGQLEEQQLGVANDLEAFYKTESPRYSQLFKSDPSKADRAMMDNFAKYFAYRVTWVHYVSDQQLLAKALKEFEAKYNEAANSTSNSRSAADAFTGKLTERLKEVLARKFESNRISSSNAAQMLPIIAKTKNEEFGDFLVDLIKDPSKSEAIKVFAMQALREYFPIRPFTEIDDPQSKEAQARKARSLEKAQAVLGYIQGLNNQKGVLDDNAIRFLRREALHTLGQAQIPAVSALKKAGAVEGPIAETMVKALTVKGMTPDPSLNERVEAALGLCAIKVSDFPEFQAQIPIYLIGHTVADLVEAYQRDYKYFKIEKKTPLIPWKTQAERFKAGIDGMVKLHENQPTSNQARILQDVTKDVIQAMSNYQQITESPIRANVESRLKPSVRTLYKTIKSADIDFSR